MIKHLVLVLWNMEMAIILKGFIEILLKMVMEFTDFEMELFIKVICRMINLMDKEL